MSKTLGAGHAKPTKTIWQRRHPKQCHRLNAHKLFNDWNTVRFSCSKAREREILWCVSSWNHPVHLSSVRWCLVNWQFCYLDEILRSKKNTIFPSDFVDPYKLSNDFDYLTHKFWTRAFALRWAQKLSIHLTSWRRKQKQANIVTHELMCMVASAFNIF